jgi:hypothetical protein
VISSFAYLDRYRNEGTRNYSRHASYSEADARYRPDSRYASFELPSFWFPREAVNVYRANPDPGIVERYLEGDRALFVVHPQVLEGCPGDPYLLRTLSIGTRGPSIPVPPPPPREPWPSRNNSLSTPSRCIFPSVFPGTDAGCGAKWLSRQLPSQTSRRVESRPWTGHSRSSGKCWASATPTSAPQRGNRPETAPGPGPRGRRFEPV